MKISDCLASMAFFAITPSLACLHTYGQVHYVKDICWEVVWAGATDNGLDVCDTAWGPARIDQDGHYSLQCIGNYVYAFNREGDAGDTAWYSNGINAYSFTRDPVYVRGTIFDYCWQTYNFNCP